MWAINRDKFIERNYVTLDDLVLAGLGDIVPEFPMGEEVTDAVKDIYTMFIQTPGTGTNLASAQVNKLFCCYL